MAERLKVVYERGEEGVWLADVPALKGCHSYGRTLEEARENIIEAIRLCLEDLGPGTTREIVFDEEFVVAS